MSDRPRSELRRESSRNSDNIVEALKKTLLKEINSAMKRPDKPEKSFICEEDLKRIWSDQSRIQTLLLPDCPPQHQINFIQRHMKMILSTLVLLGASECLADFRSRLFDPESGNALLTDDGIPFEKNELIFLESESALQEHFYEWQYRFKPVVIEVTEGERTQVIKNPKLRLPFEYRDKNIGSGGYGKVDRIGISPGYIREENDSIRERVRVVACKKIKLPKDFDQEVNNLEILKESLTRHHRIMLHLTTIEHGPNHYILLPYAQYRDLELFLHCGKGPNGKQEYDFDKQFKEVGNNNVTPHLFHECWSLADALEWLHYRITVENTAENTSSKVFCAHMDLKPANILIQHNSKSAVGKWMISDFGISVLKEKAREQDSEFVSIGDYYSQLTMNTRPKRHEGTYQAPEVKLSETVLNQVSNLTPDQRGIGRKSDIWSLGCIFSEVLAFALGRDKLVREFQSTRRGREENDYFYTEKADQGYLRAPDNIPKQYQVHPLVVSWLDGLCNPSGHKTWVDCCVETIKQILIVDTVPRPDATELTKLISHVREHIGNPQVTCHILRAKYEDLNQNRVTCAPSRTIIRRPTHDDNDKDLTIEPKDVISVTSETSSGTNSSVSTTFARPAYAHGIMIDSDVRRTPNESIRLPRLESLNFRSTAIDLTYSGTGVRAAYLARSSVYFYQLNVEEMSASFEVEVPLLQTNGWRSIAVAGFFLAAWGYSTHRLLHICDIREHQRRITLPSSCDIDMLEQVVVSEQGAAALVCREKILVVKIDTQTASPPLFAKDDQKFTDVSFNDTGELLFAWAYGHVNSLYVWRCQDCVVNEKPEFESNYRTEKKGNPSLTRVIPYNTYPGCIISTPDKRFFPAQARRSPRRISQTQLYNYEAKIFNAIAEVVFRDHSIITVEKSFLRFFLKEYKIEYESNQHILRTPGVEICRLKVSQDESSRLLVTKHNENIIVVVCNLNAMVEFVKIVPTRPAMP